MREIKFRGRSLVTGDWVYGGYYNQPDRRKDSIRHIIVYQSNDLGGQQTIHDPIDVKTLGQYTGVKDFTGREIYEGDIVKVLGGEYEQGLYEYRFICAVKWTDNGFDLVKIKDNYGVGWGFVSCEYCIIVIGNIYENPELLKEELK